MADVYELAAEAAGIPLDRRGAIIEQVREQTAGSLAACLAECMHDALMAEKERDSATH